MTCNKRWCRVLAVLLLTVPLMGVTGPGARSATAQGEIYSLSLPAVANDFTPLQLANPSFEEATTFDITQPFSDRCRYVGDTDNRGNQPPPGWVYRAWEAGELLPLPYLKAGQQARSDGVGENVHRCWIDQLSEEEWPGKPRALVLDGNWTYKIFSDHLAYAVQLSQEITGTRGYSATATIYILAETSYVREDGAPLDPQHWLVQVALGTQSEMRTYEQMSARSEISGNVRNWNRFVLTDTIPPSGHLPLTITVQANWGAFPGTDFFLDGFAVSQAPP